MIVALFAAHHEIIGLIEALLLFTQELYRYNIYRMYLRLAKKERWHHTVLPLYDIATNHSRLLRAARILVGRGRKHG